MRKLNAGRGATLACVVGLALLASACGKVSVDGNGTPGPSVGAGSVGAGTLSGLAGPVPEVTEAPAVIVPKPADPLAGKYTPVKRNGKIPTPAFSAAPGSFTRAVRYADGTSLQVVSIKQGVVTGEGPGIFPGKPTTTIVLRLTNGSPKPISLDQVVVTATYGDPQRVASPVYDATASDFGGVAALGHSRNATYLFSIPTADLDSVVMFVDFDGVHVPATFAGSAR